MKETREARLDLWTDAVMNEAPPSSDRDETRVIVEAAFAALATRNGFDLLSLPLNPKLDRQFLAGAVSHLTTAMRVDERVRYMLDAFAGAALAARARGVESSGIAVVAVGAAGLPDAWLAMRRGIWVATLSLIRLKFFAGCGWDEGIVRERDKIVDALGDMYASVMSAAVIDGHIPDGINDPKALAAAKRIQDALFDDEVEADGDLVH